MLFEECYKNYLLFAKKQQKKQSFTTICYNFNKRILPYFKGMKIEEITSKDIIGWQDYILQFNFKNNFNRALYYQLSAFFEFCHLSYDFDKTVLNRVGCFKKHYEEDNHDFYTLKEFNAFIKAVDDFTYKMFFTFMFYCGTRPGEAMALKFSDIKSGYVIINKTMNSHGNREVGTPKTLTSNRKILLDKFLLKNLTLLKQKYIERFGNKPDYYIFGGIKPLNPTTINRRKFDACKKANIRPITLHQFRHSHATLLLQNGIVINEVSRRLGHSKVSTTLDIYTHTNLEQEKRVYYTLNSLQNPSIFKPTYISVQFISWLKTIISKLFTKFQP